MTLHFPDVSQYTPNVDPAQYPILIARATLSDRVSDPTYETFKARSAAAGTFFVAYHWLNHGNVQAQAKWCFEHVGPDTPLMLDCEDEPGNTGYAGPLTTADITGFAAEYRALGGTVNLCYLPFWYWSGAMSMQNLSPVGAAGLHLVSSNYPNAGYTEAGPGWVAYGGLTPDQWQYTSTPIDMNAFRGTVQEYAAMVGGSMSEWHDTTGPDPAARITQGSPGIAGQQRDYVLAVAAGSAQSADAKLDKLLAAQSAPVPVEVDASAVAAALVPALTTSADFLAALAKAVNDDAARRLQS